MARLTLKVNGKNQTIDAEPDMPLLYALRNDLQLNGPKFGCGLSQCGACTVIIDGNAIRSCVTPVSAAQNKSVTSLDWSSYPILRFTDLPPLDVVLINRPDIAPLGAGEPATIPLAASIGNAIFDATGVRLYEGPFTAKRVLAALQKTA